MDRTEKTIRIKSLKELIKQKETQIAVEENKLKILKKKLQEESATEIPVLLFLIDETLPMPDDYRDYEYEYIYYCPDLDEVKRITRHSRDEFLPNVVDMREFFKEVGIPQKIWPGSSDNYSDELNYSVSLLKTIIDDLFVSKNINSWNDLALLLNELPNYYVAPRYDASIKKVQSRVLK